MKPMPLNKRHVSIAGSYVIKSGETRSARVEPRQGPLPSAKGVSERDRTLARALLARKRG